jgi:hypothetical protein
MGGKLRRAFRLFREQAWIGWWPQGFHANRKTFTDKLVALEAVKWEGSAALFGVEAQVIEFGGQGRNRTADAGLFRARFRRTHLMEICELSPASSVQKPDVGATKRNHDGPRGIARFALEGLCPSTSKAEG